MTREEKHLWYDFLRDYPVRILRQKVIDNYIADFYCSSANLVIELDGSGHYTTTGMLKDRVRTKKLNERNLAVLRISNYDVNKHFDAVCEYIDNYIRTAIKEKENNPKASAL